MPAIPDNTVAPTQALVASAVRINTRNVQRTMFTNQPWQDEAWALFDAIGELRYATRYEANAISRARLIAARIDPSSPNNPVELPADHPASQLVDTFGGGRPNQPVILERLATQLYVTGITWLVGHDEPDPADRRKKIQKWRVCSNDEINHHGGKVQIDTGHEKVELDRSDVVLIRLWTGHPRRWWMPDSPVHGVLPILRELDGLTKHVSANIDSRLAGAGILVLPNEMRFVSNRDDLEDDADPFVTELIDAMIEPLEDRDSAASVVPLVIRVPGEHADNIRHITFASQFDQATKELREEAIRRLALGLDIPPEILLGVGDVNHWTAWQIEESSVKLHIEPKLGIITSGLTESYLHPALQAMGEDTDGIVVWYDTTPLKLRPNRSDDAQNLHDDLLITDEARRKASGFADSDAPDPDEKFKMLLEHVIINSPQLSLELLVPYAELIGADSTTIRQVVDAIRDRVGTDGEPDQGTSDGANPERADDTVTPRSDPDADSPAAAGATVHRI